LIVELFELYDRNIFEVHIYDNGVDDKSPLRKRINFSVKNIYDIKNLTDKESAELIYDHGIDILVNLNGYFGKYRQGIFAFKPAKYQINYLGFPSTIGSKYIDFIIGDKIVIPENLKNNYTEKVIYLPKCYQINDGKRKNSEIDPNLKEKLGISKNVIVLACFNNLYKLTPYIFEIWLKLLKNNNVVLILIKNNKFIESNIRNVIKKNGVPQEKVIFWEKCSHEEHLKRHSIVDIFIDTYPYNAHTTASDALWCNLPIVTLMGESFPSRVSASLLTAIDLKQLITKNYFEYENKIQELILKPELVLSLKKKIYENKINIFNSVDYVKNLEKIYIKIFDGKY
jgi:predicted O-linked N-acetylglucosamine transferase (SPINDLY family)